jgi:hypothetical protein
MRNLTLLKEWLVGGGQADNRVPNAVTNPVTNAGLDQNNRANRADDPTGANPMAAGGDWRDDWRAYCDYQGGAGDSGDSDDWGETVDWIKYGATGAAKAQWWLRSETM